MSDQTHPPQSRPPAPTKASVWEIYMPRGKGHHSDVVYVASFPEIILFWPTIVALFLAGILQSAGVNPVTAGWFTVGVILFNFLVLVQDFDQKQFAITVLIAVVALLGAWVAQLYGFPILRTVGNWFFSFEPSFSTDAYFLLGILLLLFFLWGIITPLFDFWKFEQNEFVHYSQPIGRDMSIARLGCTVSKEIPDVLEFFLTGGGGSIVIRREEQVLATIRHVPWLAFRMKQIEHLLSEVRVFEPR